jgi:hypothetical protein
VGSNFLKLFAVSHAENDGRCHATFKTKPNPPKQGYMTPLRQPELLKHNILAQTSVLI